MPALLELWFNVTVLRHRHNKQEGLGRQESRRHGVTEEAGVLDNVFKEVLSNIETLNGGKRSILERRVQNISGADWGAGSTCFKNSKESVEERMAGNETEEGEQGKPGRF